MIPVIRKLHEDGNHLLLAGSGRSGDLLKTTFPELPFLPLPSPRIRLGSRCFSFLGLVWQLPSMGLSVFREHHHIRRLLESHRVDVLISDNRYGLYNRKVLSVLVTHQISPALPRLLRWAEYPLFLLLRSLILRFDACWIPDLADPQNNFSGNLSHRYPLPRNASFIGPLSRFSGMQVCPANSPPRLAVVISGPEPQAGRFENLIRNQLSHHPVSAVIAAGLRKVPRGAFALPPGVSRMEHPDDVAMAALLCSAGCVVCRSGYSSVMDLAALGVSALLVPTPGQTEQEYLAAYLSAKGWCKTVRERELNLSSAIRNDMPAGRFPGFTGPEFLPMLYRKYEEHRQQSEQKS